MYNNYGENQSNLKFLFVFSMKKYQGNRACCCSLWQMVIRRDSRVSTVPMPAKVLLMHSFLMANGD